MDVDLKQLLAHNDRQFDDIAKSMKEMKELLDKIDQRQQAHYVDFVGLQKDVQYAKEEIKLVKSECDKHVYEEQVIRTKKIAHVWNELRKNKEDDETNHRNFQAMVDTVRQEIKDDFASRDKKLYAGLTISIPVVISLVQWISEIIAK